MLNKLPSPVKPPPVKVDLAPSHVAPARPNGSANPAVTFSPKVPAPVKPWNTAPVAPEISADFKASLILPPFMSVPIPDPNAAP